MAAFSGQITVITAGTAVQGPDNANPQGQFLLKAHPDNTSTIWVGNDGAGDVTLDNGFPLDPGQTTVVPVTNLNQLWFDADTSGQKVCWSKC